MENKFCSGLEVRVHCLNTLKTELKQADAVTLEHAVFVLSADIFDYRHGIVRALRMLRNGHLRELRAQGRHFIELLKLPSAELYHELPLVARHASGQQERQQAEALLAAMSSADLSSIPDAGLRCSRCNSTDIAFDFLQTRSADEGTTVYCNCTSCSKRWKM